MENNLIFYLTSGLIFGLAAGFSPGPLLVLVVSETLNHGKKAGYKMAIAPLISDLPIILVITFLSDQIARIPILVSMIAFSGAVYLFYLGYQQIIFKSLRPAEDKRSGSSLRKGVIANFLNPHPYLFWFVIGGPLLVGSFSKGWLAPLFFILGMYSMLIVAKLFVAWSANKTGKYLNDIWFVYVNRGLGVILVFLGFLFLVKSFTV